MSSESKFDNFFSVCGLLGAIIFPIAILPQLYKTIGTKSSADLSYGWQGFSMGGLTLVAIYGVAYQLWPVVIPMIADVVLMITLIILKVYFDNFGPNSISRKQNERQPTSDGENKAEEGQPASNGENKAEEGCGVVEGGVGEELKE